MISVGFFCQRLFLSPTQPNFLISRKLTKQFREVSIQIIEDRKRLYEEDPDILTDPSRQNFLDVLLNKR